MEFLGRNCFHQSLIQMKIKGIVVAQAWDGKINRATIEVKGQDGDVQYAGTINVISKNPLPSFRKECVLTIPDKK